MLLAFYFPLLVLVQGHPFLSDKFHSVQRHVTDLRLPAVINTALKYRAKRTSDHILTECMSVVSSEGHYFFKQTTNDDTVCGVYIFTEPDRTVEIHFNYLDVPCENGGLVSFVDGWELNGEFFPSTNDHPKPLENRFSEFCGQRKRKQLFVSSQNAALIQYRTPSRGQGFSFTIRFPKNTMPCNILLQDTEGIHTLRNYGKKINCSISAIFPAAVQVLAINVGLVGRTSIANMETGTIHKCQKRGLDDYVQIGGSDGLDNSQLFVAESLCGMDSIPSKNEDVIFCGVTTVRLVSSGAFDNSVTIDMRKANEHDINPAATICPLPDM